MSETSSFSRAWRGWSVNGVDQEVESPTGPLPTAGGRGGAAPHRIMGVFAQRLDVLIGSRGLLKQAALSHSPGLSGKTQVVDIAEHILCLMRCSSRSNDRIDTAKHGGSHSQHLRAIALPLNPEASG